LPEIEKGTSLFVSSTAMKKAVRKVDITEITAGQAGSVI
jgi:hypothetical protein